MRLVSLMLLFPITSFSDVLLVAGIASSRTATKVNNFFIIIKYLRAKVQKKTKLLRENTKLFVSLQRKELTSLLL